MTDNKLTDEQIMKALECCNGWDGRCLNCPLNREGTNCKEKLNSYALDLLKRKDEKIELLQKTKQLNEEEVERLRMQQSELIADYKQIAINAMKKFAERLKNKFDNLEYRDENPDMKHKGECILHEAVPKVVDMVLKEMDGE